ncbi:hypothetical protein QBC43DRAFT_196930 [Cladorrhinum sp. PSN259]|nr:hypothetical protein QBC43DRAFT_196930 [Cladorrhinum sp. PSN259]
MSSNKDEAVNLLSFDGGGVRGVSSLVIIHEIMKKIQEKRKLNELPKPCDYFHMIAGTSTGGLIAIMLGRLRMSTEEALREYDECAEQIFCKGNRKRWNWSQKFRATALQTVIEQIVEKRGCGEFMRDPSNPEKGKAFVCVMPEGSIGRPELVRSFPGGDGWDEEIKIWEAVRAATVALTFFKPQELGSGAKRGCYVDAALGVNNPVEYLIKEADEYFGSGRKLGCVVSIGTGTRVIKLGSAETGAIMNLPQSVKFFAGLLGTMKNLTTSGEEAHNRLQDKLGDGFPGSYYRFNVPDAADKVRLEEYTQMEMLKEMTTEYLSLSKTEELIREVSSSVALEIFDHGLTLGNAYKLDRTQLALSNKNARSMEEPSRFFTGREDILNKLDKYFSARNTGGKPRREFLLYGLGGVGKTQIALKAAEQLKERFKYIFYIDGSTQVTINQSYARIAEQHFEMWEGTTEEKTRSAQDRISRLTDEWLMIFDDLMDHEQVPTLGRGKGNIIYTARTSAFRSELPASCVFEVLEMDEKDAIDLLLKASKNTDAKTSDEDITSARAIVDRLGCLPLAISTAAGRIRKGERYTLRMYLQDYHDQEVRLFDNPRFKEQTPENKAVYTTLELSYGAIDAIKRREGKRREGRRAGAALNVLCFLCFYHHDRFPWRTLIRALRERRAAKADTVFPLLQVTKDHRRNFDEIFGIGEDGECNIMWFVTGLRMLQQYSLVKLDEENNISMHILVQTWARHRMDVDTARQYNQIAQVLVTETIIPSFNVIDKLHFRSFGLLPHFRACFEHGRTSVYYDPYEARLLLKLGWFYWIETELRRAEELYLASLRLFGFEYGNESWSTINCTTYLAMLYHSMGRLVDAEAMYLQAIDKIQFRIWYLEEEPELNLQHKMLESQLLTQRLRTWTLEHNPNGLIRRARENTGVGRKFNERRREALTVKEEVGPAVLDQAEGKLETSRTKKPKESQDRPLDLQFCLHMTYSYLSKVCMEQGRYKTGKSMFLQSVGFLEEIIPAGEPELVNLQSEAEYLRGNHNLEYWGQRLKDVTEVEERWEGVLGLEESYRLIELVARVELENKQWDSAYVNFCEAFEAYTRIYGRQDRRTIGVLRNMAACQIYRADYEHAVTLSRMALRRAKQAYGDWHQETMWSLKCSTYENMKTVLQKMIDRKGEDCPTIQPYKHMVGDGPPRSLEEWLSRLQSAFGPNDRLTKDEEERIARRRNEEIVVEADEDIYGVSDEDIYGVPDDEEHFGEIEGLRGNSIDIQALSIKDHKPSAETTASAAKVHDVPQARGSSTDDGGNRQAFLGSTMNKGKAKLHTRLIHNDDDEGQLRDSSFERPTIRWRGVHQTRSW